MPAPPDRQVGKLVGRHPPQRRMGQGIRFPCQIAGIGMAGEAPKGGKPAEEREKLHHACMNWAPGAPGKWRFPAQAYRNPICVT
jgi:hypothetical protein